jgi:RimJ/RimL family protein N-acetyltransferase
MRAPLLFVGGTLATPRLSLQPLTPAHAPLMFEGFADPALYRWINAEPPASAAELQFRFERIANPYAPGGELWLNWTVRRTADGAYVGLIEATVRPDRVVFLAYYVSRRSRGPASRAKPVPRSSSTCGARTMPLRSAPTSISATSVALPR